jgi:hypothetical protein
MRRGSRVIQTGRREGKTEGLCPKCGNELNKGFCLECGGAIPGRDAERTRNPKPGRTLAPFNSGNDPRDILDLAVNTTMRTGEVLKLRPGDYDPAQHSLLVARPKEQRPAEVPVYQAR